MLVVTGPGRSGTSVVMELYRELGFDPGGTMNPKIRGGLEAPEIVAANWRLARALDISLFRGQRRRRVRRKDVRRWVKRIRRGSSPRRPPPDSPPRWDRFDAVVERHGERLRELARSHELVKDPRFSQTLRVWAAAGAEIEHVLVCIRPLDSLVRSRVSSGLAYRASETTVRNAIVYYHGLCMLTLFEYGIEHDVVKFPDFVEQPDLLYEAMRFPRPVSREQFIDAFQRVMREDLVRHRG